MSQLTITEIDSLSSLSKYRDKYQSLLKSIGRSDSMYYDLDFMDAMNPYFLADDNSGIGKRLYFLLAFRGEELIGVAPLVREKKRISRFGVRRIYNYGETNDSLMVSFPQCLARPHEKPECIAAFVNYLNDHSYDWDIVDLGYLFLADEIELYRTRVPGCFIVPDPMKCHAADVRLGFDNFIQAISPKHRRNFRRSREKLESSHRDVQFLKTNQLTESQLKEIEALHVRRQQSLRKVGIERNSLFDVPASKKAFKDSDDVLSRKQLSRHYLLYADGRLIAFQLCYRHRDATYFQLIAMDDDYRQYSPAKLLVLFAYQEEAQDGVKEINLLLGTNPLKQQFGKQETIHYRASWTSPRLFSILRVGLWRATQRLKARLKKRQKNKQPNSTVASSKTVANPTNTSDTIRGSQTARKSPSDQRETTPTTNRNIPACLQETETKLSTDSDLTCRCP